MDWELFHTILGYISGPLIGAIIGIFTNYIAVKMLFRPYFPKKLFGITLPFTPGIIPKRRGALAHAIGKTVGEELFTGDDIKAMLCSPEVEKRLFDAVLSAIEARSHESCEELVLSFTSEVNAEALKDKASYFLAQKIVAALSGMGISDIIATKGKEAILEKKASLGLFGAFLTDGVIDPILDGVRIKINEYLDESATDTALVAVKGELDSIIATPVCDFVDISRLDRDAIFEAIRKLYEEAVVKALSCASASIDICAIVEEKINQMDIRDLEALCLKVMKRELNAVIYLGGAIGLLLGVINIFI